MLAYFRVIFKFEKRTTTAQKYNHVVHVKVTVVSGDINLAKRHF